MKDFLFPVVPISNNQKLDVRQDDLLNEGLYRKCSTYRGGGGYDQFPIIAEKRLGKRYSEQFIVQLQKCNLDCPYCYVTREGVWGQPVLQSAQQLVTDFIASEQQTFHLMGGAPALYIEHWPSIINELLERAPDAIFHSDIMLSEKKYQPQVLEAIKKPNCLYAANIKGITPEQWLSNTRKPLNEGLFWSNLKAIYEHQIPFYLTFTGITEAEAQEWLSKAQSFLGEPVGSFDDWFCIDLIDYEASSYVDTVDWGLTC